MRVFRHWIMQHRTKTVQGLTVAGAVFGGSNLSEADAQLDLEARWRQVHARVFEGKVERAQDYEADIREEVVDWISPEVVVTRNRYGAEILNCKAPVIVDIDWFSPTFWEILLGRRKVPEAERIRRILERVRKVVGKGGPDLQGARLYRTPGGIRAILCTTETNPRSKSVQRVMRSLRADWLYMTLCNRQNCFRARLTPKPRRIGMTSLNQKWPLPDDQMAERAEWVAQYHVRAAGHAACAYIETIGQPPSSPVIDYHDHACGALSGLALA